jgi:hypothetical protein
MTYSSSATVKILLSAYQNKELDVSLDLVTLSTSKTYGRAAGAYHFTLPFRFLTEYGKRYDDIISTNDIVTIAMDDGTGKGSTMVMLGLVTRVGQVWSQDGEGRPVRSIRINGMDMGKLLLKHDCGWSITAREGNAENAMILRMSKGLMFKGNANEMVGSMFKSLFLDDVTAMAPYFYYSPQTDDDWQTFNMSVYYQTGAVWNAMMQAANTPWNVLTTETDPDPNNLKFSVILEKMPIKDDGRLNRTASVTLQPQDGSEADIGKSDDERVNYCWLEAALTTEGVDERIPIYSILDGIVNFDTESVARNGYNGLIQQTDFSKQVPSGQRETSAGFLSFLQERSFAMWNRVRYNQDLWSGSFTIHHNPYIRAGSGLLESVTNRLFLVETVNHQMTFGEIPHHVTTLSVSRGEGLPT